MNNPLNIQTYVGMNTLTVVNNNNMTIKYYKYDEDKKSHTLLSCIDISKELQEKKVKLQKSIIAKATFE